jgi:hypothetical protein
MVQQGQGLGKRKLLKEIVVPKTAAKQIKKFVVIIHGSNISEKYL